MIRRIALAAAVEERKAPVAIARAISDRVDLGADLVSVEVAPPGFLNLTVSDDLLRREVLGILQAGAEYGRSSVGKGEKVIASFAQAFAPLGEVSKRFP